MSSGENLGGEIEQFYTETQSEIAEWAGKIRDHVRSQVDQWQQIQLLALQVNGKTGWSNWLSKMSNYGLVHVGNGVGFGEREPQTSGTYGVFIDCASGELLRLFGGRIKITDTEALASNEEVFNLWATKAAAGAVEELSANYYMNYLNQGLAEPTPSFRSHEWMENWSNDISAEIARRGLTSRFERSGV